MLRSINKLGPKAEEKRGLSYLGASYVVDRYDLPPAIAFLVQHKRNPFNSVHH